jgi:hypothetical protein
VTARRALLVAVAVLALVVPGVASAAPGPSPSPCPTVPPTYPPQLHDCPTVTPTAPPTATPTPVPVPPGGGGFPGWLLFVVCMAVLLALIVAALTVTHWHRRPRLPTADNPEGV